MKLKHLLALAAVAVGSSALAQTDVTSQYLVNADFEEAYVEMPNSVVKTDRAIYQPNGWTVKLTGTNENDMSILTSNDKASGSFSDFKINHSGEQTYWVRHRWGGKQWQTSGNHLGQDTALELQQEVTLPAGIYTISADMIHFSAGTEANNFAILKIGNKSVTADFYRQKNDDGWKNYSFTYFSDGTPQKLSLRAEQNWTNESIVGFDDVKIVKHNVDADHPYDITELIVNNSFENGFDGWTNAGNMATQKNESIVKDGSQYAEFWQPNGTKGVEQTIKDLPAGLYKLTVHARTRGTSNAYIYINDVKTNLDIDDSEKDYEVTAMLDANSEIKIGLRAIGSGASGSWIACDNFRLAYVSAELPALPAAIEGKMNNEIATAQTAAISAYETNPTAANYNAATAAIKDAQASVNMYATNKAALDAQKALMDGTNIYNAEGWTAYNTAYTEALTAYENGTATETVVNPTIATGWRASTAYNFLLTPWKLDDKDASGFEQKLYINTWSTEGDTDGSNFTVPFFELYADAGWRLGTYKISSSIPNLENGLYKVEALVRVQNRDDVSNVTGISLSVNDGAPVDVTNGSHVGDFVLGTFTAEGLVKEGTLNILFDLNDTQATWLSFKNVKYTKVRDLTPEEFAVVPTAIALDKAEVTLTAAENTVTLTPTFTPEDATETVIWETSNASVATVANGVVTGVAPGTATITVKSTIDENVKATCEVTVEYGETDVPETIEVVDKSNPAAINVSTLGDNIIKNGSFEYPNGVANWTAANNSAMTIGNFQIGEEEGNHYLKATANAGGGDAKSIGTAWAIEAGKTYVFSYRVKNGSNGNSEFHKVSLTNAPGTETKQVSNNATPVTTDWTTVSYKFTNSDNYQYVQFRGRWLGNSVCFDDFYLAEVTETSQIGNVEYAKSKIPTSNVGTGAFLYSQAAIDATNALVQGTATVEDVENAIVAMTTLNAPAADKRYTITNVSVSFNAKDKAMTYMAGERSDMGGYNIRYLVAANANYAQAFKFTATGVKNTYYISQIDNDGVERYVSTGKAHGGDDYQIRTTTESRDAAKFLVSPMEAEGNWSLKNVAANEYLSANSNNKDNGVYTSNQFYRMVISEAQEATATLAISGAKYGTFIAPFDAEIPAGVTVNTCAEVDGNTLTLEPATTIKANTAYIVYAESEVKTELKGWGLATKDAYETGVLTGSYELAPVEVGKYLLQNNGNVGFYLVAEEGFNIGANRCYLTAPETAKEGKAFYFDNATAIEAINALATGNVKAIYNAAGAAQKNLVRGLNIVKTADGKTVKVMVK